MRLTMLFAGPFEDDIDWKLIAGDPNRRPGVHSWLGRVFAVVDGAVGRGTAAEDPRRWSGSRTARSRASPTTWSGSASTRPSPS